VTTQLVVQVPPTNSRWYEALSIGPVQRSGRDVGVGEASRGREDAVGEDAVGGDEPPPLLVQAPPASMSTRRVSAARFRRPAS
jgi:hypothetical protein